MTNLFSTTFSYINNLFSKYSYAKIYKIDKQQYSHIYSLEYKLSIEKKYNLNIFKEIITNIEKTIIKPKQIFSFWKIVKPIKENNYETCIISSMLYHISLLYGICIVERHHFYSKDVIENYDLYLGVDAEVLYKTKDLKLLNKHNASLKFKFEISYNKIICSLLINKELLLNQLSIKQIIYKNRLDIFTRINKRTIAVSSYKSG